MQGKLGGDTVTQRQTDITPALKKEIGELQKKKTDLQGEIERAIIGKKLELEQHYDKKERDLIVTYQSKLNVLEDKTKSLDSREKQLRDKDAALIQKDKDLQIIATEQERIKTDNIARSNALDQQAQNNINALSDDKKAIEEGKRNIIVRTAALDGKETELNSLAYKIADKKIVLDKLERGLNERTARLDDIDNKLSLREKSAEELVRRYNDLIIETQGIRKQAATELQGATEAHQRAEEEEQTTLNEILKTKEVNDALSKNLQTLQESLFEKEKSLKERERVVVLKNKEIDDKIATLKKLREGVA
jgi:DNA repair exonuclease SbcCD ATPase subunit